MKNFKLDNAPKISTGFKVPENYFENFSKEILKQLPQKEPKVISIFSKRKIGFYAAAGILIIGLTITLFYKFNSESKPLDQVTLENYLSYQADFSEDELTELLNDETIKNMKLDYSIEDKTAEEVLTTNSNFEDYLID